MVKVLLHLKRKKMEITLILTNWRRKNNLTQLVKKVMEQSIKPKLIVIDNSSDDVDNKFIYESNDIVTLNNDNSKMCWARWEVAIKEKSKYVCIMDDDLIFSRDNVLEDCFNYMESNPDLDCIGLEGVKLMKSKGYFASNHQFAKSNHTIPVSIIKGRFMFIKTKSLSNLDMTPDLTCDDIKVSSHLNKKILPSILWNSFYDLPQGSESLSGKHFQQVKREYATKKYFKN